MVWKKVKLPVAGFLMMTRFLVTVVSVDPR
jgi:hypothetical protein